MFVVLILWAFKEFCWIFLQLHRVKGRNEGEGILLMEVLSTFLIQCFSFDCLADGETSKPTSS